MGVVDPVLKETIARVVRQQIRDGDPPETKATFDRLCQEGHSAQEAYRLLDCVLVTELYEIGKGERDSDRERYVKHLAALPRVPWE